MLELDKPSVLDLLDARKIFCLYYNPNLILAATVKNYMEEDRNNAEPND